MIPIVKICKEASCSIVITDVTQDSDQYVDESITDATAWHQKNDYSGRKLLSQNILTAVLESSIAEK